MQAVVRRTLIWSLLAALLSPALVLAQDEKKEAQKTPAKEKSVEDLKKDALALNNIRSEEAVNRKIKDLTNDKPQAKRLIQAALPLLANKDEGGFNYNAAHILGAVAVDIRENKAAIEFLKLAVEKANKVKSDKKVFSNRLFLVEAYLADNRPAEAEKVAEKMATQRGSGGDTDNEEEANFAAVSNFYGMNLLVRTSMMQGDFTKAQKQLDTLENLVKRGQLAPAAKAFINRTKAYFLQYKGDLKESIKVYEELSEEAENDEEKDRYKEQIGNIYADLGEVDKAVGLMSEVLKRNPDNAGLNNDLGYILAVHNRKLDEAEKMVKKAVEKEPDNSSFLDSMAWVYFKQKKYKEAKEYMQKALAQERTRNTELLEHLGDIQLAVGDKDEAKKSYEKALAAITPAHKDKQRKPELEKKLKELSK